MKMLKMVKWCFNFHEPDMWIDYITNGDINMYNHFMKKWEGLCRMYQHSSTAFLYFFCELNTVYQDKLEKYIELHYKN